ELADGLRHSSQDLRGDADPHIDTGGAEHELGVEELGREIGVGPATYGPARFGEGTQCQRLDLAVLGHGPGWVAADEAGRELRLQCDDAEAVPEDVVQFTTDS